MPGVGAVGFAIGVALSRPQWPTLKTSIRLPLNLVATTRRAPSGLKPTIPGEAR